VTQTALDQQQALQGHPSLANNMEDLMEEKISRLMDKQLSDRIPKHVTKVMKSWGRKNSSGGRHQPPAKPNGNTSDGPGSRRQPPTANQHAKRKPALSTEPTGKPKDSGKRHNKQTAPQQISSEIETEFAGDAAFPGKKRKRLSRRKAQWGKRRQQRKEGKAEAEMLSCFTTQRINTAEQHAIQACQKHYGFAADPDKPIWENIPHAISQMPPRLFLERPEK
jgi:hypothetical protein